MRKILFLACTFFLLLLSIPNSSQARNKIFDDIELVTNPSGSEIHIFFNSRFQVTGHNPNNSGDFLQIELRPVDTLGIEAVDLLTTENVTWSPSKDVPLFEVVYEGDSSFPLSDFNDPENRLGIKNIRSQLTLRFQKKVDFKVNASTDLKSIIVFLPKQITTTKPEKSPPLVKQVQYSDFYVLNLMSTPTEIPLSKLPKIDLLPSQQLYTTKAEIKGQTWHRWRLGFYASKTAASIALENLKKIFPDAWVVEISHSERSKYAVKKTVPKKKKKVVERKVRPLSPERLASLLEEAEKEMTAGNYNRAIQLYGRILQHPDPEHQQKALEILGLARERKGQSAHAKALYEEYLALYPESEGATRVQQRLTGMLTARSHPKESLRKGRTVLPNDQWEKEFFGSIAQDYHYDESTTDGRWRGNLNALTSDADLNLRVRNEIYDIQAAFAGSNENDFSVKKDDDSRVSVLSLDFLNKKNSLYGRVGRQSVNTGGILGRFDGILTGYQITPTIKVNGVFGYPVASSRITEIDKSKHFYGINFDLGTFADRWDYNLFFIEQEVDDIIDRRAIGGEIKYYQPNLSLFTLIDYDIHYDTLNTLLMVGNWKATEKTSFNVQADLRESPLQTTSNALQGQQGFETITALLSLYTEEEINQFAKDRTATTTSLLIGTTHDFNDNWQLYGDATTTKTDGTDASGGVDANPGTGNEYFYNLQLIGNSLIKEGDLAIFGLRYSDLSTRNAALFSFNTRYPVTRDFRVNPRIRFETRQDDDGNGSRTKLTPSLRLDYRLRKDIRFELEGGLEFIREENNTVISKTDRSYIILRYRFLF